MIYYNDKSTFIVRLNLKFYILKKDLLEDIHSAPQYQNAVPCCPSTKFFSHKRRSTNLFVFSLACPISCIRSVSPLFILVTPINT